MIKYQISALSSACFDIEAQLPLFNTFEANNNAQELRRELYRVRISLNGLIRHAELVDEENAKTKAKEEILLALNKLKGIFTGETGWNPVHQYVRYDTALDEIELYISQYEKGTVK